MCIRNRFVCLRNWLFFTSRVSFILAIICVVIALIFCWIGFSVPDWMNYTTINSYQTKFGLWSTCTQSISYFSSGYSCSSWSSSLLPDFVQTTQAVITLGCIFCTFSAFLGILSIFMNNGLLRFLPILAAVCALVALIFLIIGLSVFGGDYASFAANMGGTMYYRRWGYWIFVPAIILLTFTVLLFPFNYIYKNFLSNRLYNFMDNKKPSFGKDIGALPAYGLNSLINPQMGQIGGMLPIMGANDVIYEYAPGNTPITMQNSQIPTQFILPGSHSNISRKKSILVEPNQYFQSSEPINEANYDSNNANNLKYEDYMMNGYSIKERSEQNYIDSIVNLDANVRGGSTEKQEEKKWGWMKK